VANVGSTTTSYTDGNLTDGQTYCHKVTSVVGGAESSFSNILCATADAPGQTGAVGVDSVTTGVYETTGKGKNKTTTFVASNTFSRGDTVVVRAVVVDSNGLPISGATVDLSVTGPETVTLTIGQSDADGVAEASWTTSASNKHGNGGSSTGTYTATVTGVTGTWDGVAASTTFTLN
jgi:hypothetical protein